MKLRPVIEKSANNILPPIPEPGGIPIFNNASAFVTVLTLLDASSSRWDTNFWYFLDLASENFLILASVSTPHFSPKLEVEPDGVRKCAGTFVILYPHLPSPIDKIRLNDYLKKESNQKKTIYEILKKSTKYNTELESNNLIKWKLK